MNDAPPREAVAQIFEAIIRSGGVRIPISSEEEATVLTNALLDLAKKSSTVLSFSGGPRPMGWVLFVSRV